MENDYELATTRSLELEGPHPHNQRHRLNSAKTSNQLVTQKMLSHLTFIETEFARNIEWQRQLVNQIYHHSNSQVEEKQVIQGHELCLNLDQQRQLRLILCRILGDVQATCTIKQLIRLAAEQSQSRVGDSPAYSFSPLSKHTEDKLDFPAVPRVITLNDLAPSTQREISATPPSLPPRTPKSKPPNPKNTLNKGKALVFTPKQSDREDKSESPIEIKMRSLDKSELCKGYRQLELQDSLGKRLFKDVEDRMIYIEVQSERESIGSQVSLNLSMSNQVRKGENEEFDRVQPRNHSIKFSLKSGNFEHESIYLPERDPCEKVKQIWTPDKNDEGSVDGLAFREFPRRKIGRPTPKQESVFSYQQICLGKVRKMHDSFGQAYQEYYLEEGRYDSKEGSIYRYKNSKNKQL